MPTRNCWGGRCWHGEVPQHVSITAVGRWATKSSPHGHSSFSVCTVRKQIECVHSQQQAPVVPSKTKKVQGWRSVGIWVNRGRRDARGGGGEPQSGPKWRCWRWEGGVERMREKAQGRQEIPASFRPLCGCEGPFLLSTKAQ